MDFLVIRVEYIFFLLLLIFSMPLTIAPLETRQITHASINIQRVYAVCRKLHVLLIVRMRSHPMYGIFCALHIALTNLSHRVTSNGMN